MIEAMTKFEYLFTKNILYSNYEIRTRNVIHHSHNDDYDESCDLFTFIKKEDCTKCMPLRTDSGTHQYQLSLP